MFEILAYLVMRQFGVGWLAWIASVICNTIVQVIFMIFERILKTEREEIMPGHNYILAAVKPGE